MLRDARNSLRLIAISFVLARYDVFHLVWRFFAFSWVLFPLRMLALGHFHRRPGERLARALTTLGPTFIKFGQALSTRPDIVGEAIADDLSMLQGDLPPFSFEEARQAIEDDLGKPLDELFATFDEAPVAAASIAQVHYATGKDGERLAVKVLRPGIEARFEKDIDLLLWLAEMADARLSGAKRLKLVEAVRIFAETSRMEMDLRFEAAAAEELKENFADEPGFKVPAIHWRLTAQRVMTMEWMDGTNIYEREKLIAAGHDLNALIAKAGEVFFKQVFRDGFFHADMHPGNLFIDAEGNIVALDFGIMGRLDVKNRLYLAEMLKGFFERDYEKVSRVHFEAGYVPRTESEARFAQACRAIAEPIFGLPQNEISVGGLLAILFKVTREFNMETQPQLLLLQKTLVMAEGLGRILNPNVNIWQLAAPYIEEWAVQNLGPQAKLKYALGDLTSMLMNIRTFFDGTKHISAAFTPQGLKLHPTSEAALQKTPGNQKVKNVFLFILVVAVAAASSALTACYLLRQLP
jgi:ubiquinone biosynthesis protein